MVVELSDLAVEYTSPVVINAKNETFNTNLIKVLEEYTLAIVDSLRQKN
jgi:hypothetical protein